MKQKPLNEDVDAQRWAREFMEVWNKNPVMDEGWMLSWFANAIMCGMDVQRWKMEKEAEHLRMQIGYISGELQLAGDKRSTPEIVENAAAMTTLKAAA